MRWTTFKESAQLACSILAIVISVLALCLTPYFARKALDAQLHNDQQIWEKRKDIERRAENLAEQKKVFEALHSSILALCDAERDRRAAMFDYYYAAHLQNHSVQIFGLGDTARELLVQREVRYRNCETDYSRAKNSCNMVFLRANSVFGTAVQNAIPELEKSLTVMEDVSFNNQSLSVAIAKATTTPRWESLYSAYVYRNSYTVWSNAYSQVQMAMIKEINPNFAVGHPTEIVTAPVGFFTTTDGTVVVTGGTISFTPPNDTLQLSNALRQTPASPSAPASMTIK